MLKPPNAMRMSSVAALRFTVVCAVASGSPFGRRDDVEIDGHRAALRDAVDLEQPDRDRLARELEARREPSALRLRAEHERAQRERIRAGDMRRRRS